MDEPLEQVVSGSSDLQTAIAEHRTTMELQERERTVRSKLSAALRANAPKRPLAVVDEVCAEEPNQQASLESIKFGALLKLSESGMGLQLSKLLTEKVSGHHKYLYNDLA
jgi:hypothetical protein